MKTMADQKNPPLPAAPYVNSMQVTHTKTEFYFIFGQLQPQSAGVAHLVSQIVTSPAHAKQVMLALQDNIQKYEGKFGTIDTSLPEPKPEESRH